MILILVMLFSAVLFGIPSGIIGARKGMAGGGFWLGFLLGPIGLIIALVARGNRIPCSSCKELIQPDAKVCPRCQREVVAAPAATPEVYTRPPLSLGQQ